MHTPKVEILYWTAILFSNTLGTALGSLAWAFALLALPLGLPGAWAQAFPSKPIRLIVPYSAGGGADTTARLIAPKLQEALGQTVVVENKPGAGGMIGDEIVAKATPDGHTLLIGAFAHAVNPSLFPKMPFRTPEDFAPVSLLVTVPELMVITPSHPAKTVAELVALAKAQPGKLSYASWGNGSSGHILGHMFSRQHGLDATHIAYKGGSASMSDQLVEDLKLPRPDLNLEVGSGSHAVQTAEVMKRFEPALDEHKPSCVLVVGDVNSTLACTLVAVKKGVPVVHVEAGLRSGDRRMPEEINRVLTDQISDRLFTTELAVIVVANWRRNRPSTQISPTIATRHASSRGLA